MAAMGMSTTVTKKVRAIVFSQVSRTFGSFFSAEDRNMLVDLHSFGIDVYFFSTDRQALYRTVWHSTASATLPHPSGIA